MITMAAEKITKIDGVWTESDVTAIKNWINSAAGVNEIKKAYEESKEDSKTIEKMAIVDPKSLKVPFTFTK